MILKSGEETSDFEFIKKFEIWFNSVRDKYLRGVEYFVKSPKRTMSVLGGIVVFILAMFIICPTGFLPDEDRGAFFTQVQLPDGATLSRTGEVAQKITNQISEIPGVESIIQINGFNGENTAFIVTKLKPWGERKSKKLSINNIIRQVNAIASKTTEATAFTSQPPAISGMGMFGGFEYQLLDKGDRSPEELYNQGMALAAAARQNGAIASLYTSFTSSLPQVIVNVDEEKALAQGAPISEVYSTLAAQFGASYINDFNKYGRVYRVYMQADSEYRANMGDLNKVYVKNNKGKMLPLTSVITTKNMGGPYKLTRFNMYPSITFNGTPTNGVSSGTAMAEMEKVSEEMLPNNMGYAWSGVSLQEKNSAGQIGPILAMALTFVYLFLVALYESWTLPIAVLMISPIALLGAVFFQYVSGLALDIYAQVGLVMLIGLSTKQAILVIEFAKDAMEKDGMGYLEAAMQAAKLRFRAVMMTNIAFILGLLPLVFANGAGAGSRHSIGVSVFGGMMAVAFIGSLLVPAFFVAINVMKEKTDLYIKNLRANK